MALAGQPLFLNVCLRPDHPRLMKERGAMKLHLSKLRVVPEKLKQIIRIGLPAGMQGALSLFPTC